MIDIRRNHNPEGEEQGDDTFRSGVISITSGRRSSLKRNKTKHTLTIMSPNLIILKSLSVPESTLCTTYSSVAGVKIDPMLHGVAFSLTCMIL